MYDNSQFSNSVFLNPSVTIYAQQTFFTATKLQLNVIEVCLHIGVGSYKLVDIENKLCLLGISKQILFYSHVTFRL